MALRLRPYQVGDEAPALAAHEALLHEDFHFLLGWHPTLRWANFLATLEDQRRGRHLDEDHVRAAQVAAVDHEQLVGRASIRFELNESLAATGGHIGYAVVPRYRRLGFASEILRHALVIARAEGVDRVLMTCDDNNVASSRVIEGCGGIFESLVTLEDDGRSVRRYWID